MWLHTQQLTCGNVVNKFLTWMPSPKVNSKLWSVKHLPHSFNIFKIQTAIRSYAGPEGWWFWTQPPRLVPFVIAHPLDLVQRENVCKQWEWAGRNNSATTCSLLYSFFLGKHWRLAEGEQVGNCREKATHNILPGSLAKPRAAIVPMNWLLIMHVHWFIVFANKWLHVLW